MKLRALLLSEAGERKLRNKEEENLRVDEGGKKLSQSGCKIRRNKSEKSEKIRNWKW